MKSVEPLRNLVCPLCGGANQCAVALTGRFDVACWCSKTRVSPEALARVPTALIDQACLCPACASVARIDPLADSPAP